MSLTALASCNDDKTEPSGGTPSVAIGEITPQSDRLTFALTLRDAEKAFYLCLPATESAPSAETLAAQGIPVSQSQTVTVDGLLPETAYTISAVAMQGDRLGSVATASATTAPSDAEPAVKLTPGEATTTSLSFSLEMQDCARAAYLLIANPKQGQTPDAEEILRSGTTVESDGTHTVNELTPATTYLIAAVGEKDSKRSEVVTIEMTTGFDASAPATFDRQVAGFYYGVPAGYNYAEYYVVLSEGEATEQEGIYTTTGAGRTLSIDLYSRATPQSRRAPTNMPRARACAPSTPRRPAAPSMTARAASAKSSSRTVRLTSASRAAPTPSPPRWSPPTARSSRAATPVR